MTTSTTSAAPAPDTRGAPESAKSRLWLLMYHSVLPAPQATPDPYNVTVSTDRLDRQLRWLRRRGLRGVSVGELLRAAATGPGGARGLVGLTFDDGYTDFLHHALPVLLRHGCTATAFVLPGRLGGVNTWDMPGPRKPLLTADGIRAVARAGIEIGSHGLTHVSLPRLADADPDALRAEAADSRALLREITGREVAGFCYPYGTVDARAIDAVRAAGYDYACAIDPGPLTCRHALPRVHVGADDTAPRLTAKRLLHPLRRRGVALPPPRPHAWGTPTGGAA
ncbi:polysaccharide deacetylase family protein [Streptomyces sp. 6N223]|uniref:polysaccharide deacetylase family protein n=1 Tax=Streptomyces sp. 6N223 TaxID=3457412 RepID=UPI003FD29D70